MVLEIKYGLYYKDRLFVWIDKELWSYPYKKNNRSYSLRKIKTRHFGKQTHYRLCKDWICEKRLEQSTVAVNVEPIFTLKDKEFPF